MTGMIKSGKNYEDIYWDDDYREGESIKSWMKKKYSVSSSKISDFEDKTDWVVRYRVWQEEQEKAREDYNDNT